MAVFKCKMCGGDLEVQKGESIGTCFYCGSRMTLPKVTDERIANLFNRANHFRRINEFDKAILAYENILNEVSTESEAHFGLFLSKFGVEYIEDPVSHERVPTCHRIQFDSILNDVDYLAAIENAPDTETKNIYNAEAQKINEIQRNILAISKKEEKFDVFICYKETNDSGARTQDSIIAQDLYYILLKEGFKVFFSKITLEDKLGQMYEPYIFAALNSSKIMLLIGTKIEYLNSVWVKNEWSRFLALIKNDKNRLIIPCYRDLDPYDLPEEISTFQSQDMSKIGFTQDLLRGVKKILENNYVKESTQSIQTGIVSPSVLTLLKRAKLFLEDNDFKSADEYFNKVLDLDPECAEAYFGRLMIEFKIVNIEDFEKQDEIIELEKMGNYIKALRFGDNAYKKRLTQINESIINRNKFLAKLPREVGSKYQGGIIFYILKEGDIGYETDQPHGLIVSLDNQSEAIEWCKEAFKETFLNKTMSHIGSGSNNTDIIVAKNGNSTSYAAGLANKFSFDGYSDWYLPSKDELNELYKVRDAILNLNYEVYWSSTECDKESAWGQNFIDGEQWVSVKKFKDSVRAIRKF